MSGFMSAFRRRVKETAARGGREIRISIAEALEIVDAWSELHERLLERVGHPTRTDVHDLSEALGTGDPERIREAARRLLGRLRTVEDGSPSREVVETIDLDAGGFRPSDR